MTPSEISLVGGLLPSAAYSSRCTLYSVPSGIIRSCGLSWVKFVCEEDLQKHQAVNISVSVSGLHSRFLSRAFF
ncbi:hypothetical protein CR513_46788, partial [Mucuna pruriens]